MIILSIEITNPLLNLDQNIFKEFLTVSNVVKALDMMANQWIRISELLKVPFSVVNSILVTRMNDQDSLRRVVEWWFKNTANPEWTPIKTICKYYSEGCDRIRIRSVNIIAENIFNPPLKFFLAYLK